MATESDCRHLTVIHEKFSCQFKCKSDESMNISADINNQCILPLDFLFFYFIYIY